jgi:Tfp pilus assembly protein PilX
LVVISLLTLLIVGAAGAVCTGKRISRRLSDYTAAAAVVEAKVEDIRAATYNPPNSPFTASTVTLTNASSIALDQAGTSFVVAGTVTSTIQPVTSGHLVTVTGTFQSQGKPIVVTLQTVVNKFSAGQQ